jgi:hypothetical protein
VLTIVSSQSLSEDADAVAMEDQANMVTIDDQANIVAMEGESLVSDVTEHSDGIVMVTEVTGEIVTPTDGILTVTEVSDDVTSVTMEGNEIDDNCLQISNVVTTTEEDGSGDACGMTLSFPLLQ